MKTLITAFLLSLARREGKSRDPRNIFTVLLVCDQVTVLIIRINKRTTIILAILQSDRLTTMLVNEVALQKYFSRISL